MSTLGLNAVPLGAPAVEVERSARRILCCSEALSKIPTSSRVRRTDDLRRVVLIRLTAHELRHPEEFALSNGAATDCL